MPVTVQTRPVYAHKTPSDDNPHAVKIEITLDDARRWQDVDETSQFSRTAKSRWVTVTDVKTGDRYDLRSYPCGLGCRCAAQVRPHGSNAED